MPITLDKEVLADDMAISVARAVAAANQRARREGIELHQSSVTVTEQSGTGERCWQINYGPKNYIGRRGGDLIVEVGIEDAQVKRVLRGQ